jgi:hypothetical protein
MMLTIVLLQDSRSFGGDAFDTIVLTVLEKNANSAFEGGFI